MGLWGCLSRGAVVTGMSVELLHGITMRCHYLLDEKYTDFQDLGLADAWKAQLLSEAQSDTTAHYDLFTRKGGGPNGAEWNSDGAIYVTALVPYAASEISQVRFLLNRQVWSKDIVIQSLGAFTWITTTIPGSEWTSRLKPSSGSNEKWLQSSGDDLGEQVADQQLDGVAQILNIDLHLQWRGNEVSFARAFQWAGGE